MGLALPLSLKNMLQHRDMSKVRRYGVCICTFTGTGTSSVRSLMDPSEPSLSVKSIGIQRKIEFPLYIKSELLAPPPGTTMDAGWYDRLFSDPLGVASYFRKMSGGR